MNIYRRLRSLSIDSIILNAKYSYLRFIYRANANPKRFDWDWDKRGFNRISLVNFLVSQKGGSDCRYLEIGCQINNLFNSVPSFNKIGVDPDKGGTHRMTSDKFFEENSKKFDVIFIDGLHEYQQVRRDALNSLNSIDENGWIAFHDFLPRTWKENHIPRLNRTWQGDIWKLAVELSKSQGIEFYIVDIDHGVGLMRKSSENFSIPDMHDDLSNAQFDRFIDEQKDFPIISFEKAIEIIAT